MIFTSPEDANILSEKKPAQRFEEAYPLGNGWLGAMIYGKTDLETISLNHDTLWSGYPRGDKTRGQLFDSLQKAKEAVTSGKLSLVGFCGIEERLNKGISLEDSLLKSIM